MNTLEKLFVLSNVTTSALNASERQIKKINNINRDLRIENDNLRKVCDQRYDIASSGLNAPSPLPPSSSIPPPPPLPPGPDIPLAMPSWPGRVTSRDSSARPASPIGPTKTTIALEKTNADVTALMEELKNFAPGAKLKPVQKPDSKPKSDEPALILTPAEQLAKNKADKAKAIVDLLLKPAKLNVDKKDTYSKIATDKKIFGKFRNTDIPFIADNYDFHGENACVIKPYIVGMIIHRLPRNFAYIFKEFCHALGNNPSNSNYINCARISILIWTILAHSFYIPKAWTLLNGLSTYRDEDVFKNIKLSKQVDDQLMNMNNTIASENVRNIVLKTLHIILSTSYDFSDFTKVKPGDTEIYELTLPESQKSDKSQQTIDLEKHYDNILPVSKFTEEITFKNKYLKYKQKYIKLKKLI